MMKGIVGAALVALALAATAHAQEIETTPLEPMEDETGNPDFVAPNADQLNAAQPPREEVMRATGATIRALDKMNAEVRDFDLVDGQSFSLGDLEVTMDECRYPAGDIEGDAYAYIKVRDTGEPEGAPLLFSGWMIASAPALNALDHSRYDVWVMRCSTR